VIRLRCRLAPNLQTSCNLLMCTARHAQLRDLGLRPEIKSRSGQIALAITLLVRTLLAAAAAPPPHYALLWYLV
jgi:hypothetical protein